MVALPAIGLLLVVVADLVPSKPIVDQLVEDQSSGRLSPEQYDQSAYGNQIDEFTECIGATMGLGNPVGTNPLESADGRGRMAGGLTGAASASPGVGAWRASGCCRRWRSSQ